MLQLSLLENIIKDEQKKHEEKREAALKAANIRSDLLQKMGTRTGLFEHTAESMAEKQKLHKFILLCTYDHDTDERKFDSKEEYQEFLNDFPDLGSALYKEAYFFDYELPEDVSETWAEVQFLRDDVRAQAEEADNKNKKKAIKKRSTKKIKK